MVDRYFTHEGEQWRCSATNTPLAPAGRPREAVGEDEGRTRLYFWSASGVMRSVVYPSARQLTEAEIRRVTDDELRALLEAPAAKEMGRLRIVSPLRVARS